MAEHKALGMVGSAEFFAGIDKLECKIKWNALYPNVLRTCANPFLATMIQVRASLETYNGAGRINEVPATAFLIGTFKEFPLFDKFTAKRNSDEPLFLSVFNNRMERTQSYRIIRDACREVGIDYKIGTHTLRKTFGYHHYKKFKDVALLQKIFNHSSPAITLRYIGIDQEEIDESYNNFIL